MKKSIILILIFILFASLAAASSAYALFVAATEDSAEITGDADTETGVVAISSEYLLRQHAFDRYYNGEKDVSDYEFAAEGNRGQRETLLLTEDITLSYPLTVNRDVNIDLGGNTLSLGEHTLTFSHRYFGTLTLSNGTVSTGAIVVDIPNALFIEVDIVRDGITVTGADQSEAALAANIFQMADPGDGVFLYDLPLMAHYYNTDIVFGWESGTPGVVTDGGKVTRPAVQTAVILTLTLTSPSFAVQHTHAYTVTIASATDDRLSYGVSELTEFFELYSYGTDTVLIYGDITLLKGNSYYGLDYSYQAEFVGYTYPDVDREGYVYEADIVSSYLFKKNTYSRDVALTVTVDNQAGGTVEFEISVEVVVETNLDLAINFVNSLESYMLVNESETIPLPVFDDVSSYGISKVPDFSLIDNGPGEGYYEIVDGEIRVITLPESAMELAYVRMGFTFAGGYPKYVERDVEIFYVDATGLGGDVGLDRYDLLYLIVNQNIIDETSGRTYTTFSMKNEISKFSIDYGFIPPEGFPEGALTITRYDDGNTFFDIDVTVLPPIDTLITITYIFEGASTPYERFSYFTIPGIINNNSEGVPDDLLYDAMFAAYNAVGDTVLTADEAKASKPSFSIPSAMPGTVDATYKGVEFLKGTKGFDFSGRGFAESDMAYLIHADKTETLILSNCGLVNDNLDMFAGLINLKTLDFSSNVGITSLANLSIGGNVTTLILNDCGITDISPLSVYTSIKSLSLINCDIKLFDTLRDITALETVEVFNIDNPIIDTYYGAQGAYNVSTFVQLTNKNVAVYNDYDAIEELPIQFGSDFSETQRAAYIQASAVLEGVFYYTYSKVNTSVAVPVYVRFGDGTNDYYTIVWSYANLSSNTYTPTDDLLVISHSGLSTDAVYEIYGSVTVGTVTVTKVFYIEVKP